MHKRIRIAKVPRHRDRFNRGRWAVYVIPYPGSLFQFPLSRHRSQAEALDHGCAWLAQRAYSVPVAFTAGMDWPKTWEGDYA